MITPGLMGNPNDMDTVHNSSRHNPSGHCQWISDLESTAPSAGGQSMKSKLKAKLIEAIEPTNMVDTRLLDTLDDLQSCVIFFQCVPSES